MGRKKKNFFKKDMQENIKTNRKEVVDDDGKEIEKQGENITLLSSIDFNFLSFKIEKNKEMILTKKEYEAMLQKYETIRRHIQTGVIKVG